MTSLAPEQEAEVPPRAPAAKRVAQDLASTWVGTALLSGLFTSALLVVCAVFVNALSGAATQAVLLIFLMNLLVVLGLQTYSGNSGIVSFGHMGFVAIGAYVAALATIPEEVKKLQISHAPSFVLHASLGFLPATVIAIVVTAVVALPVGIVLARLRGSAAAIATLAFFIIVLTVLGNWDSVTAGTATLYGIPNSTTMWWALGWCVVVIFVARLCREAPFGLGLRASSADELVAQAVGVNLVRARVTAWTVSAGMAAASGALYAHFTLALAPSVFSFSQAFLLIVMAVVGGRSVSGAVVGAAIVTLLSEGLRRGENATGAFGLSTLVLATFFLLMIVWRPAGLLGRWELDELARRALRRRRRRPPSPE